MSKILKPLKAGQLFTYKGHIYQVRRTKQGWGVCRCCYFYSACSIYPRDIILPRELRNVCEIDVDTYIKLIK